MRARAREKFGSSRSEFCPAGKARSRSIARTRDARRRKSLTSASLTMQLWERETSARARIRPIRTLLDNAARTLSIRDASLAVIRVRDFTRDSAPVPDHRSNQRCNHFHRFFRCVPAAVDSVVARVVNLAPHLSSREARWISSDSDLSDSARSTKKQRCRSPGLDQGSRPGSKCPVVSPPSSRAFVVPVHETSRARFQQGAAENAHVVLRAVTRMRIVAEFLRALEFQHRLVSAGPRAPRSVPLAS